MYQTIGKKPETADKYADRTGGLPKKPEPLVAIPKKSFFSPLSCGQLSGRDSLESPQNNTGISKNYTGIPTQLKSRFEVSSGLSLDDVRVHYQSQKPAQLQAYAYTQGNQVFLGPGQERHLAHELGHVVQQKLGMVEPTTSVGGLPVNESPSLERQADTMQFMRPAGHTAASGSTPTIQRKTKWGTQQSSISAVPAEGEETPGAEITAQNTLQGRPPAQATPTDATYPLMVYESFGPETEKAGLAQVYNQSKQYPGYSICVLGINKKVPDAARGNAAELGPALNELRGRIQLAPNHDVCIVPFIWSPTKENTHYEVPYFEVRGTIMGIAKAEAEKKEHWLADSQVTLPKTVYRWIDRDVQDDTTQAIPKDKLTELSEAGEPRLITGAYDWRSVATAAGLRETYGRHPTEDQKKDITYVDKYWDQYTPFLTLFNQAERAVRKMWFDQRGPEAKSSDIKKYGVGFYLPEPTLIMNEEAHAGMAQHLLAAKQVRANTAQDQESMAAVSGVDAKISYLEEDNVSKPVKSEGMPNSYLKELENLWKRQHPLNVSGFPAPVPTPGVILEDFQKCLSQTRQSAFNNGQWYFISNQQWAEWWNQSPAGNGARKNMQRALNTERAAQSRQIYNLAANNFLTPLQVPQRH